MEMCTGPWNDEIAMREWSCYWNENEMFCGRNEREWKKFHSLVTGTWNEKGAMNEWNLISFIYGSWSSFPMAPACNTLMQLAATSESSTFWPCPHLFIKDEYRDTGMSAESVAHEISNLPFARPLCLFVEDEHTRRVLTTAIVWHGRLLRSRFICYTRCESAGEEAELVDHKPEDRMYQMPNSHTWTLNTSYHSSVELSFTGSSLYPVDLHWQAQNKANTNLHPEIALPLVPTLCRRLLFWHLCLFIKDEHTNRSAHHYICLADKVHQISLSLLLGQ